MSIFADKNTKVLIQGITGKQASFHVQRSMNYGTDVVAGVTPGKGGTTHLGVPVFDTVKEAIKQSGANASVMFVPARQVVVAVTEGVEAELDLMVCIADNVPVKDMLEVKAILKGSKTKLIGPNTPGLITPEEARLGIFPENIHNKGRIGIVSRSSTLTYEAVLETKRALAGQSTVIGLGDDMIIGIDFVDCLRAFHEDTGTDAIVMIGQMGGLFEEEGAAYYQSLSHKKPIIGCVAGNTLPAGHNMGYVGEVMTNGIITVQDKVRAMQQAGIIMVDNINDIHKELAKVIAEC
ncbi:MAG: succinate--CoA ligase subunit alpha [Alphaproteobacteria bacterium]|nr:succinate--CoA ligase subunit alpha [Alphaproteobacteria bacterium]